MNQLWQQAKEHIDAAEHIVVLQAENPDGDSLGSALALEEILSEMGKQVTLFCKVTIPGYLHYFPGWDRVTDELPKSFDLSIVVDASVQSLFEKTLSPGTIATLSKAPMIIFDHHAELNDEDVLSKRFQQTTVINEPQYVATSELLHAWTKEMGAPLTLAAREHMASSILSDSLGLMSEGTTPHTAHTIAELMDGGVRLSVLDARRREYMKKSPEILAYKGTLLQRVEYHLDGQLALITIPWDEIAKYSDAYNPSMLALDEMRLVEGVRIAIAIKTYPDGKLTAAFRANPDGKVAATVAVHFGGGGHPYAAGFKMYTDDPQRTINELIAQTNKALREFDATRTTTEPC